MYILIIKLKIGDAGKDNSTNSGTDIEGIYLNGNYLRLQVSVSSRNRFGRDKRVRNGAVNLFKGKCSGVHI